MYSFSNNFTKQVYFQGTIQMWKQNKHRMPWLHDFFFIKKAQLKTDERTEIVQQVAAPPTAACVWALGWEWIQTAMWIFSTHFKCVGLCSIVICWLLNRRFQKVPCGVLTTSLWWLSSPFVFFSWPHYKYCVVSPDDISPLDSFCHRTSSSWIKTKQRS